MPDLLDSHCYRNRSGPCRVAILGASFMQKCDKLDFHAFIPDTELVTRGTSPGWRLLARALRHSAGTSQRLDQI
jgi:hypothetical protein